MEWSSEACVCSVEHRGENCRNMPMSQFQCSSIVLQNIVVSGRYDSVGRQCCEVLCGIWSHAGGLTFSSPHLRRRVVSNPQPQPTKVPQSRTYFRNAHPQSPPGLPSHPTKKTERTPKGRATHTRNNPRRVHPPFSLSLALLWPFFSCRTGGGHLQK